MVKSILETERSKEKHHRQKAGASAGHGLPPIGPVTAGSVIIRCYNEHASAGELVRRVTAVNIRLEKELVILDGSSGDGTRELLKTLEQSIRRHSPARVEPIFRARNRGKCPFGGTGMRQDSGERIVIRDADLKGERHSYCRLLQPTMNGAAEVALVNRFHKGPSRVLYFFHFQANRFLTLLTHLLIDLILNGLEVGCKIFRRDIFDHIQFPIVFRAGGGGLRWRS